MKRKRIQYNEISEETYAPKYWTKLRLIFVGFLLLILGFLANFSLEDRLNKFLQTTLNSNQACPIQFDRAEISYFMPKIIMKRPVIMGACFGHFNNRLEFKDIKVAFNSPSFYPVGFRLHVQATTGKSYINMYPVISVFSQNVKIENTMIDAQMFAPMFDTNTSPISGQMSVEGFFEFKSGSISDGVINIISKNFLLPSQNIKGFELTQLNLETLNLSAHFSDPLNLVVDKIQIGKKSAPIELSLKGVIKINENNFLASNLSLNGNLILSEFILTNFSFIKLFLPESNTSGNYQMKINGPLGNPGAPEIL